MTYNIKQMRTVIIHNWIILINMIYRDFFIMADKVKEKWFVLQGKGTVGEYHMSKLAQSIADDESTLMFVTKKYTVASYIIKKLKLNEEDTDTGIKFFHNMALFHYYTDYYLITALKKAALTKTPEDILECISDIRIADRTRVINCLGLDHYTFIQKTSLDDMFSYLMKLNTEEKTKEQL